MIMKIFLTTNYSTVQTGGTVIAETNQHTHTKLKASQNVIDSNGKIKLSWTRCPWKRRPVSRDRGQNPGPDGRRARGGNALPRGVASTSTFRLTNFFVTLSMCVYSISSSKFFLSFSLFLVTSLSSTSSFCSCSWKNRAATEGAGRCRRQF